MIEFTECKIVQNKTDSTKTPWICLGYKTGKRASDMTVGNKKAWYFLKNLDAMNEALKNHNSETDGLFTYNIEVNAGTKYADKIEITSPKLSLINHYKKDLEAYLEQYPYVPFKRELITKPIVKTEEVGLDYVKVLYLPCYTPNEDEGSEGLVAKRITQKTAKFLLEKAFKEEGGIIARFKKAVAAGEQKVTYTFVTNSGQEMKSDYEKEYIDAVLKYKEQLMSFAISGTIEE